VKNAQRAGAIAAIVADPSRDNLRSMGGSDPSITIPSLFIGRSDAQRLRQRLGKLRVRLGRFSGQEPSLRWLVGEDPSEFGRVIRDMWNPGCLNDPGKTTDPLYYCTIQTGDDRGGVHRNSGIPNRAYALFADGGAVDATTIAGVGLTRAAHVYWRAMALYQTQTSDFADHGDALEQACADLATAATTLVHPLSGATSGEVVTTAHCTELARLLAALPVRIRQRPDAARRGLRERRLGLDRRDPGALSRAVRPPTVGADRRPARRAPGDRLLCPRGSSLPEQPPRGQPGR
jgi:hypothetical protein